jgi:hypothetical protein
MKAALHWMLLVTVFVAASFATEITAPDGRASEEFGFSIAVSGNILAVINFSGVDAGKLYVYEKNGSWKNLALVAELEAPNQDKFDSVAVWNGVAVVGAPASTVNGIPNAGCVYVFTATTGVWQETARLTASDATQGAFFGMSVGINNKNIVVGAEGVQLQGEAYIFTEPVSGWTDSTQTAILSASDRGPGNEFGTSVSINGIFATVGAPAYAIEGATGAIYLYQETKGGWQNMTETAKLTDGNAIWREGLGQSLAMLPGTIVAGTPHALKALVYVEGTQGWQSTSTPTATLTGTVHQQEFGVSVAINPALIIVGDPGFKYLQKDKGGVGFVFHKPAQGWTDAVGTQVNGIGGGRGQSVAAVENETVFLGAPVTVVNGNVSQGAVFFTLRVP